MSKGNVMTLYPRDIFPELIGRLDSEAILIIEGARQVGKTTILKQVKAHLDHSGKPGIFINLEDPDYLRLLNEHPRRLLPLLPSTRERSYVLIDEIQYLRDPSNFLKFLHDEYRDRIKLIVSGSSAFYMDEKFRDSLAGRKRIFTLRTLCLGELMRFRGMNALREAWEREVTVEHLSTGTVPLPLRRDLEELVEEYALFGGYPRVVLAREREEKEEILGELASSYVRKDILEAGARRPEKFFDLIRLLADQVGGLLNANELANTLGLSLTAVNRYLLVLRRSFHIALVRPFHANLRKELTKMPKVYFLDLGLRNYFCGDFSPLPLRKDKGRLFEALIFRQLVDRTDPEKVRFWRTQGKSEVDFLLDGKHALEVKYDAAQFRPSKYKVFRESYPEIPLRLIYREGEPRNLGPGIEAYRF